MSGGDLAVLVLQNVSVGAVEGAGPSADKTLCGGEAGGVLAELAAAATGFNANEFDTGIAEELVKEANGIRTATDAGEEMRREAFFGGEDLLAGFAADDGLKIADPGGLGVSAQHRTQKIMSRAGIAHPVSHSLVASFFEGAAAGLA